MIDENTIIKKSYALYSRYGIKRVSVDDVAFMLGISKKTLYENIINKNILIEKVVNKSLEEFSRKVNESQSEDEDIFNNLCQVYATILKEIAKLNPSYVHDLKKYHGIQYKKVLEFRDNVLFQIVSGYVSRGIETGIFRNDLNIRFVFFNQISKISIILVDNAFECSKALSLRETYSLLLNDIRGITTLRGHEIFDKNYESLSQIL